MGSDSPSHLWPHRRVSPHEPAELTPESVAATLKRLAAGGLIQLRTVGRSYLGREITAASIGGGPRRVLAWSQMHGDEPTHTAMLLDVLAWLAAGGDDAQPVLRGCTLTLAPMLNPDGAAVGTRHNAQGIDVNRDARRLQSPEGRILHDLVEEVRPHFAFNLHNQNARSTVGRSQLPSVVALMAPPIDLQETESPGVRRAKQAAVCFSGAVAPHCPGMVSRYAASYMPRAFGEWVQTTGAATVLVEAGGMPADAPFDMVELHAMGFARTLKAIAGDRIESFDASLYDALPLDGEITRFDLLVREATIVRGHDHAAFLADLGINFPGGQRLQAGRPQAGVIEELGDLQVTSGKAEINAAGMACRAGRWVVSSGVSPVRLPDRDAVAELLHRGATSCLGGVDVDDANEMAALERLRQSCEFPLNLGFLARLSRTGDGDAVARLAMACLGGACGVAADRLDVATRNELQRLRIPVVDRDRLTGQAGPGGTRIVSACQLPRELRGATNTLHGVIGKDAAADLVLFRDAAGEGNATTVLVGGVAVLLEDAVTDSRPGGLLTIR